MKKIRFLALGLSALMLVSLTGSAMAAPWKKGLNNRPCAPVNRVQQGVRNSSLTRVEAQRLQQSQMQINQQKRQAMADGRVTPAEARRLAQMKERHQTLVYKLSSNNQFRR